MTDVFTIESGWEWHYDDTDPTTLTHVVQIGSASTDVGIIEQLEVGTNVLTIAANCFNDSEGHKLTKILSMPGCYTNIGDSAFSGCTLLTLVVLSRGLTSIGASAFASCIALTSITIPNAVITIGASAFSGDVFLTTATIGGGVTTIGASTFSGCTRLTSIYFVCTVIPSSVGANWILNTAAGILGHAYYSSNFPLPGATFNGLIMGVYNIIYTLDATIDSALVYQSGVDYGTIHGDATGLLSYAGIVGQYHVIAGTFEIYRTVFIFDTSIVPKQELITNAKLRCYCRSKSVTTTNFDIVIQLGDPQHPGNPVAVEDYDEDNYDGADGDYNIVKSTADITPGTTFDLLLTNIGFLLINKAGETRLMIRSSRDINSDVPPLSTNEQITIPPPTFLNPKESETQLIITAVPPVESSGTTFEFLSAIQLAASIDATETDVALPDVVVPALPVGYTIYRAIMFLKCRSIEDTSGSANQLSEDQNILIQKGSGPLINCLQLKNGMFPVNANAISDGHTLYGEADIKAVVDGAGTYSFKIKMALADEDSLILNEVQVGIRIIMRNY